MSALAAISGSTDQWWYAAIFVGLLVWNQWWSKRALERYGRLEADLRMRAGTAAG